MFIFLAFIIITLILSWYTSQPKNIGKWWSDILWYLGVIGGGVSLFRMLTGG